MITADFGEPLAIHGPNGPITKKSLALPRVKGGKTQRDDFNMTIAALLAQDDVVVEAPTVGSSGCEPDDVRELVAAAPNTLYTLSARAVKNYRMDNGLRKKEGEPGEDVEDAEILWLIATNHPERLRVWHEAEPCDRQHTSVRPMDKRGYRDERAEAFMALLPAFSDLPNDLKAVLGVGADDKRIYSRSLVMPFAMALTEPYWQVDDSTQHRERFQKVLGLYDSGYPSFYRRMTVVWMQTNAKLMTGKTHNRDVTPAERKAAWKATQKQIRALFYLSKPAALAAKEAA